MAEVNIEGLLYAEDILLPADSNKNSKSFEFMNRENKKNENGNTINRRQRA